MVRGEEVNPYDDAFWEEMRGCREAYFRLADCIREVCSPFVSVLDMGCGLRFVLDRLDEKGVPDTYGWDFYSSVADRRVDLRRPQDAWGKDGRDLVICTETAEHLPEEFADTLVETVCKHARHTIVWSAAQPGQEGTDHVNLQPPSYWLKKFAAEGWVPNRDKSFQLQMEMRHTKAQHYHCAGNFYVLEPAR